jgi:hypothetical protein
MHVQVNGLDKLMTEYFRSIDLMLNTTGEDVSGPTSLAPALFAGKTQTTKPLSLANIPHMILSNQCSIDV